jgi:hypothetical protein
MTMAKDSRLTDFATKAGISISYASQLLASDPTKRRVPTVEMAVHIYRRTGRMLGILEGASAREAKLVLAMAERTGTVQPDVEPQLIPVADAA